MSLDTWKEEFYPVDASQAANTQAVALSHSLQKWKGLRQSELKKHGLIIASKGPTIVEESDPFQRLDIASESCALCRLNKLGCNTCILLESRDGISCDEQTDEETVSPYHAFQHVPHNPEPMITALEDAKNFYEHTTQYK